MYLSSDRKTVLSFLCIAPSSTASKTNQCIFHTACPFCFPAKTVSKRRFNTCLIVCLLAGDLSSSPCFYIHFFYYRGEADRPCLTTFSYYLLFQLFRFLGPSNPHSHLGHCLRASHRHRTPRSFSLLFLSQQTRSFYFAKSTRAWFLATRTLYRSLIESFQTLGYRNILRFGSC